MENIESKKKKNHSLKINSAIKNSLFKTITPFCKLTKKKYMSNEFHFLAYCLRNFNRGKKIYSLTQNNINH